MEEEEEHVALGLNSSIRVERGEMARLLADGLRDLGYFESAQHLERESGHRATSERCQAVFDLLQEERYLEALELLDGLHFKTQDGSALARNLIQEERYAKLVLNGKIAEALACLRKELYVGESAEDLQHLALLLACPTPQIALERFHEFRAKQFAKLGMRIDEDDKSTSALTCVEEGLAHLLSTESLVPKRRLFSLLERSLCQAEREVKRFKRAASVFNAPLPLLREVEDEERVRALLPRNPVASVERELLSLQNLTCLAFSPDGTRIAVGTSMGGIVTMCSETLQDLIQVQDKHAGPVRALDWQPQGLLSVHLPIRKEGSLPTRHAFYPTDFRPAMDKSLLQVHLQPNAAGLAGDGIPMSLSFDEHPEECFHMGRPMAKWLNASEFISAGPDGWMKKWQIKQAAFQLIYCICVERVIDLVIMSGGYILLACADGKLHVYDDGTGAWLRQIPIPRLRGLVGGLRHPHALAYSAPQQQQLCLHVLAPDGEFLEAFMFATAVCGSNAPTLSTEDLLAFASTDDTAGGGGSACIEVWALPRAKARVALLTPARRMEPNAIIQICWNPQRAGHLIAIGNGGLIWSWA